MAYKNIDDARRYKREYMERDYVKEREKLYRLRNKDKISLKNKRWELKNKEIRKRKKLKYAKTENVMEKNRINSLKWYYKNKERSMEYAKRWKKINLEWAKNRQRNYLKKRRKTDMSFLMSDRIRGRFKGLLKSSSGRRGIQLLGCTLDFFKIYIETKFLNGMNWENHGDWHIDHIKPCASFDLTNDEEQKKCFYYTNLQPLWALDNLRKGSKIIKSNISIEPIISIAS